MVRDDYKLEREVLVGFGEDRSKIMLIGLTFLLFLRSGAHFLT